MIIKALTIENFKGIREPVRIEFKPITLLFGPNSAGKSTIVQALHYIREILERNNVDADRSLGADESFDLGGFRNLVHKHDLSTRIRFRIEMSIGHGELQEYPTFVGNYQNFDTDLMGAHRLEVNFDLNEWVDVDTMWVELEVGWSHLLGKPYLTSYSTGLNGAPVAGITCSDDGKRVRISKLELRHPSLVNVHKINSEWDILDELFHNVVNTKVVGEGADLNLMLENVSGVLPVWGKGISVPTECFSPSNNSDPQYFQSEVMEFLSYLSQLIVGPGELLLKALNRGRYIGPIRKTPPRNYSPVNSRDDARWSSGLAAWDLLYQRDLTFINEVNRWLASDNRLNTGYSVKLKRYKELDLDGPAYLSLCTDGWLDEVDDIVNELKRLPERKRLTLIEEDKHIEVQPHDIGIGISQLLPVVVAALDGKSQMVLVEQPELHIHPRIQAELGDLFIEAALGESGNSFIIETHSEHLLLRIMRRIRESYQQKSDGMPLSPEAVGVWYVEQYDNKTVVREMLLNKQGELVKAWPGGFFEEGLREVF
ncbi:AAA family ATPase [Geobacter anodireducens]|nr:hypothetical protein RW64_09215 [Geobacter sulfurreducens]